MAKQFREGTGLTMFTSDVSARGVDYPDVTLVLQVWSYTPHKLCPTTIILYSLSIVHVYWVLLGSAVLPATCLYVLTAMSHEPLVCTS